MRHGWSSGLGRQAGNERPIKDCLVLKVMAEAGEVADAIEGCGIVVHCTRYRLGEGSFAALKVGSIEIVKAR